MSGHKFDPAMLDKLNDPGRLARMKPDMLWDAFACAGARVAVDIGAGTGVFARYFASKMNGATVYACDSAPEMIAWMEAHVDPAEKKSVIALKTEESVIPLNDSVADLVYLIAVYHELQDPAALLDEAKRLLKAGGTIAVIDWKPGLTQHGPPQHERIAPDMVIAALTTAGYRGAREHAVLESHYVITALK